MCVVGRILRRREASGGLPGLPPRVLSASSRRRAPVLWGGSAAAASGWAVAGEARPQAALALSRGLKDSRGFRREKGAFVGDGVEREGRAPVGCVVLPQRKGAGGSPAVGCPLFAVVPL